MLIRFGDVDLGRDRADGTQMMRGVGGQRRFANRKAETFRRFVYIYAAIKFSIVTYLILFVARCYSNVALVALLLLDDVVFRRAGSP
jgi:hypothetical protein